MFRHTLILGLVLSVASPAFAQDQSSQQASPAASAQDYGSMPASAPAGDHQAPADDPSASGQQARRHPRSHPPYNPAAMALTGNDPRTVAYQNSDREKTYPAVDHGHVPGDPPVIDHSDDRAPVPNPTTTSITVPPAH